MAIPKPQTRLIFTWNGRRRPLILPPTYAGYNDTTKQVEKLLAKIPCENGYKSAETALPLNLLAARTGLVQYGRNNICYFSRLGSFFQLVAMYSDMPCEEDSWQEARLMISDEECELCRHACLLELFLLTASFRVLNDASLITMKRKETFRFPSGWRFIGTAAS